MTFPLSLVFGLMEVRGASMGSGDLVYLSIWWRCLEREKKLVSYISNESLDPLNHFL